MPANPTGKMKKILIKLGLKIELIYPRFQSINNFKHHRNTLSDAVEAQSALSVHLKKFGLAEVSNNKICLVILDANIIIRAFAETFGTPAPAVAT